MIEWLIGTVIIGSLIYGSRQSATAKLSSRPKSQASRDERAISEAEWRQRWEPSVDRTQWIPKGTAARITKSFARRETRSVLLDQLTEIELASEFEKHNAAFRVKQKERLKPFFDTVESNPLTDEQIEACIRMDDAVQVVAAAGSGKTSTMVARVGYALREGLAKPEQILLLAFNRSVAEELGSRIATRLADVPGADAVTVETFNAFGKDVVAKVSGRQPTVAEWAQSGPDVAKIVEIIADLGESDAAFKRDWDMFRIVFGRQIGIWGERSRTRGGILTANGELVKSEEERMIADWLFYHEVDYRYEQAYEHDTATETRRQYCPDFFYPDLGLYHEHFALNERNMAPPHFKDDYLAGVEWKREAHAKFGTQLFETTSHSIRQGDGFEKLSGELQRRGAILRYNPDRLAAGQSPLSTDQLAGTIRTFQQHVKSNGLSIEALREKVSGTFGHADRERRFLALFERISAEWDSRLRQARSIDFDDMLLMAADYVERGAFASPYTMIMVDEFQDASRAKVRLMKALLKSAGDRSSLCVVGDDWQGINRFAGADISVMTEFEKQFEHATRLTLGTTFRCPRSLCEASSRFVQVNPKQIRKSVSTTSSYERQALFAYASESPDRALARLEQELRSLHGYARDGRVRPDRGDRIGVLLLGRYRSDGPSAIGRWERLFGDHLDIEFKTVHSAKGLEADYVMLINVTDGTKGFPSRIEDDPLLHLAMPAPDPHPFAEERRLFYVALTRARRQVRIYTLADRLSPFVVELADQGALRIETDTGGAMTVCPRCRDGVLRLRNGPYGAFEACSAAPECKFKRNVSDADSGRAPTPRSNKIEGAVAAGDRCPVCRKGSMVVRSRAAYRPFLGCSAYPACNATAPLPELRTS